MSPLPLPPSPSPSSSLITSPITSLSLSPSSAPTALSPLYSPLIPRLPPAAISYDLTHSSHTTITLLPCSTWSSGLHRHATHTEYLPLIRSRIAPRQGNRTRHPARLGERRWNRRRGP